MSDFVCEEVSDGLSLVAYRGVETDIYIPSCIGMKKIVEIKASFHHAIHIFIPKTVLRILPAEIEELKLKYDANNINTISEAALNDMIFGGIPIPAAPFGLAQNLIGIEVDPDNPVLFSNEGILYEKTDKIVRFPPCLGWENRFLEGISVIGNGAFCGYKNYQAMIELPESVTEIEDNAFALANVTLVHMENSVKRIGELAFAYCNFKEIAGVKFPLFLPDVLESIGQFSFMYADISAISINNCVKEIPGGAFLGFKGEEIIFDDDSTLQVIHAGAFASCSKIEKMDLPKSVVSIDAFAFYNCEKLFCVTIPKDIRFLSSKAFYINNILKYILFKGNSRCYFYFRLTNNIESADYLKLVVNKDQWFKWWKAKAEQHRRKRIKLKIEKLYQSASLKKMNRTFLWGINLPTVLCFMLSFVLCFIMDYRRLVMEIAPDWQYWTMAVVAFLLTFMSAKHIYWSIVVWKTKRSIVTKNKLNSESPFFDALLDIVIIGVSLFAIISLVVTVSILAIF